MDCRKQIPAIGPAAYLGAAAIGGLGNVVQGLFGSSAQDKANETNIMLAREGRDWQSAENQKARDFQLEMWNRQNEYNTPLNQRRLAEEAGYNPYLLGNENLGSGAGSAGTPAMSGAPDVAKVSPVNPMSGLGAGFSAFSDMVRMLPQIEQVESNKQLQSMQALDSLSQIMTRLYKEGGQQQLDDFMESYAPLLKSLNFEGSFYEQRVQREFLRMDIENDRADLEKQLLQKYGDKEASKRLDQIDAVISELKQKIQLYKSQGRLNDKTAWALGAQYARDMAAAGYFNAQSGQILALLPYTRSILEDDSLRSDMDLQETQAEFESNEDVRKQKKKNVTKKSKSLKYATQNNYVSSLISGVSSVVGEAGKAISPWISPLSPKPLSPKKVVGFGDW